MKKTLQELKAEASKLTKEIVILDREAKELGEKLHANRTNRRNTVIARTALFAEAKKIRKEAQDLRLKDKQARATEKAQRVIEKAKASKTPKKNFSDLTPQQLEKELAKGKAKKPAATVAAKRAKKS